MQKQSLSFDQLPAAVYQLCQEVSELKRLIAEQHPATAPAINDKPLTVAEAAEFLGISKQTVYQNIARIPNRKKHGRLFFYRTELAAYLNGGGTV